MAQHLNPDNDCGRRKMCREFPWLLKSWWSFILPKRRCCIVKACLLRISFYCRILWSLTGPVWACQIDLMVVGVILFQITYWIALKIFFNFIYVYGFMLHLYKTDTFVCGWQMCLWNLFLFTDLFYIYTYRFPFVCALECICEKRVIYIKLELQSLKVLRCEC